MLNTLFPLWNLLVCSITICSLKLAALKFLLFPVIMSTPMEACVCGDGVVHKSKPGMRILRVLFISQLYI